MATEDRKMSAYTNEDFMVLFRMMGENQDTILDSFNDRVQLNTPVGSVSIRWSELQELILKNSLYEWITATQDIESFLHGVPFNRIPLHLHDYPELARWRLRIGK
jgi:hypothetical protein